MLITLRQIISNFCVGTRSSIEPTSTPQEMSSTFNVSLATTTGKNGTGTGHTLHFYDIDSNLISKFDYKKNADFRMQVLV